jgi:hypothetical protein
MNHHEQTAIDAKTGRQFFVDRPRAIQPGAKLAFLLNLHGGGSHGSWQRLYFPASELADEYALVIATPSAAIREPLALWTPEADDAHLRNVVEHVAQTFGTQNISSFWLVGHSQGGMTCNRLLFSDFFAERVDGWLSLSGGRIGPIEVPFASFVAGTGARPSRLPEFPSLGGERPRPGAAVAPNADVSFIFATGEHEMVALPETSPWAERYGAGPRVRLADIVDEEPGRVHDKRREGRSTPAWGFAARPGTAQLYVYPNARGGRVIADVVRLDKGHTEGLEPRITRQLVAMMVAAPGGKLQAVGV